MRSKPIEQIMLEAKELAADGAVELNLIGQDTTSYGTDIGYAAGLSGLLKTLDRKLDADVRWVRLMYAYPSCFTDEMIKTIADSGRILKYIDMPLQHINDEMLTKMKRRVTRREIEILLEKLRKWVPGIAIRTTFIAGSPGETQDQHDELVKFVREFSFDMMGVFAYSQEPGTPMGKMEGQLADEVKQERVAELMLAQQEVAFAKAKSMKGKKIEVLVDRPADRDEDKWVARATFQAPEIDSVTVVNAERLYPGQLLEVSVSGSEGYDLIAGLPKRGGRSLKIVQASA
jgi:ribosomal protein S12 methylthiotransferase